MLIFSKRFMQTFLFSRKMMTNFTYTLTRFSPIFRFIEFLVIFKFSKYPNALDRLLFILAVIFDPLNLSLFNEWFLLFVFRQKLHIGLLIWLNLFAFYKRRSFDSKLFVVLSVYEHNSIVGIFWRVNVTDGISQFCLFFFLLDNGQDVNTGAEKLLTIFAVSFELSLFLRLLIKVWVGSSFLDDVHYFGRFWPVYQ